MKKVSKLCSVALHYKRSDIYKLRFPLQWATKVLQSVDVVAPGSGVGGMHQLNVESTVRGVCCTEDGWLCPDAVVGTDSHTAACCGLGVLSIRELCDCL